MVRIRWFKTLDSEKMKKFVEGGYKWFMAGGFFIGSLWTYNETYHYIFSKKKENITEIINQVELTDKDNERYNETHPEFSEEQRKRLKYKEMKETMKIEKENIEIDVKKRYKIKNKD